MRLIIKWLPLDANVLNLEIAVEKNLTDVSNDLIHELARIAGPSLSLDTISGGNPLDL